MSQNENKPDATDDAIRRNTTRLMEHWHAAKDKVPSGVRTKSNFDAGAQIELTAGKTNDNTGASKKATSLVPEGLGDSVETPILIGDATDTIKKIMDLRSSIESTVEKSQASHRPNTTAFPQLAITEGATIPAMSTTEGGKITAMSTARGGTIPATSTAEGSKIPAMSTVEGAETERLTAYPSSLLIGPDLPKVKNLGLATPNQVPRKTKTAAKLVVDRGNLSREDKDLLNATGYISNPSILRQAGVPSNKTPPSVSRSVSKKHVLLGQKGEPAPPTKRQATIGSKASAAQPKQRAEILVGDVAKTKSRKRFNILDPLNNPPPPITILPVNPADPTAYPNILARAPLDRPAFLLGDDFADARSTDPVASDTDAEYRPRTPENPRFPNLADEPVPQSWLEAEDPDRMLYHLYEVGHRWWRIRAEWHQLTGNWLEGDILPDRLVKFKENMLQLEEGDAQRLITAVRDVEAEFHKSKWELVADRMAENGGADYPLDFLQKKHKELEFEEVLAKGNELMAALEESAAQKVGKVAGTEDADEVVDLRGYRAPAAEEGQ